LRGAHLPRLAKHLDPLLGAQLLALLGEVQRVGAVRALQRAAVGQLGEQPQRQADLGCSGEGDPVLRTGHLHELLDVVTELGHAGELLVELGDDRRHVALAVDQPTDQAALSLSLIMPSGYSSTWPFCAGSYWKR
jgi:hypothetical protein